MQTVTQILAWTGIIFLVIIMAVVNNHQPTDYDHQNAAIPLIQTNLKSALLTGFQKGKVDIIYPYFDEIISICMEGKEEIYLAYNAKIALSNFFESFPPKQFKLSHDGKSRGGKAAYWVGDYKAKMDVKFRIYIFSEKELIQEIEITKELLAL